MENALTAEDQKKYGAGLLLSHMWKEKKNYDVLLLGADDKLQPTLQWLLMKELVEINEQHHYTLTSRGTRAAQELKSHYRELLTYLDIFAHVDLGSGEFALSSYTTFTSPKDWLDYTEQERWEDLRLPVMTHLGGFAPEFVFLQFIEEERFNVNQAGWQLGLNQGLLWQDLEEICALAYTPDQLSYEDEELSLSGEQILENISQEGFHILRELYPDDAEIHANLQSWHPKHASVNHDLPPAVNPTPVWQRRWSPSS